MSEVGGWGRQLRALGIRQWHWQGVGMPAVLDLKARAGLAAVVTGESTLEGE